MKILFIMLLLSLTIFFFLLYKDPSKLTDLITYFDTQPCTTQNYYIGILDVRFNLSPKQFQKYIDQAAQIWSNAYGKTLFVYNPAGTLPINLIYDRRNFLDKQITWMQQPWEENQPVSQKINEYQQKLAAFQKDIQVFNTQAATWNQKTTTAQYQQMIAQQQVLQEEQQQLANIVTDINNSTPYETNYTTNLNYIIQSIKNIPAYVPEEGLYDPGMKKINIYFYNSPNEIVHTIAHELGHSLGLEHNNNPKSIMYYLSSTTTTLTQEDRDALTQACQPKSFPDKLLQQIKRIPFDLGISQALKQK